MIIADNLCNSKAVTLDKVEKITNNEVIFSQIDVTDKEAANSVFANHEIDSVIHFAGLKAVGESVEKPLAYYYNNLVSTMILAEGCSKYDARRFVFSYSATVYGENEFPFVETMNLLPN